MQDPRGLVAAGSLRGGDVTTVRVVLGAPRRVVFAADGVRLGYLDQNRRLCSDAIVLQDGIVVQVAPWLRGEVSGGEPWFGAPIEDLLPWLGPLRAMLPLPGGRELRFAGRRVYLHEGRVLSTVAEHDLEQHGIWLLPAPSPFTTAS
ncbi:MAG: hypothetical protein MUC36_11150 [Planctomycetes bacterium]|jgi:hypothetical protein|nr:hypothetical protein [Planctomycetota bacterium]